jgi:hypothetical protein
MVMLTPDRRIIHNFFNVPISVVRCSLRHIVIFYVHFSVLVLKPATGIMSPFGPI